MSPSKPNLLWIFCDQLRAHSLSLAGDPNVRTPHIDSIARDGINFSLAISQYPVCSPFRAGLLTGQFAHINGLRVFGDMLPPDRKTVAHAFRAAGYRTSWHGKWHVAGVQGVSGWKDGADYWVHPLLRGGFEDWAGFDSSNHFYHTRYSIADNTDPQNLEGYQTDALTNLTLDYLAKKSDGRGAKGDPANSQPWFHVLSVEAPHPGTDLDGIYRNAAPEKYKSRFDPAKIKLRPNVPPEKQAEAREMLAGYYAQIENLDDNVGRILAFLDSSNLAENTLVVFFSDHGELAGSHGRFEKEDVFDESIRIPILMRLPSRIPAGLTSPAPFSGLDLFPTCASLCGVPVPPEVQGLDLSAAALNFEGPARTEAPIQWIGPALQGFGNFAYRAIRTATHTYAVSDDPARNFLFDNLADPYQQKNLFADPAAQFLRQNLHLRLTRQILSSGEPLPPFITPTL